MTRTAFRWSSTRRNEAVAGPLIVSGCAGNMTTFLDTGQPLGSELETVAQLIAQDQ